MTRQSRGRTVFAIAPAYNESEAIAAFISEWKLVYEAALGPAGYRCELILVDDGSSDGTFESIAQSAATGDGNFRVTGVQLSRNFGQQAAIQAGLEYAARRPEEGCFFVIMDSDLQHPPKLVPTIVEHLEEGFDHVQMIRHEPESISIGKRVTSTAFYWVLRRISGVALNSGSSDFRGMTCRTVRAYLQLQERGRFNRGLFHWIGFKRCEIVYQAEDRRFGKTKYSLSRMLSLGVVGLLQFSSKPLLWICSITVLLSLLVCAAYLCFEVIRYLKGVQFAIGWPSLIFLISFWSGAIALTQFVVAVYIARIFDEIKRRPIYIVRQTTESHNEQSVDR